eukprot:GILI01047898.1.p1 GENE.GILI01047898.1~~GILI01047898.1.p1  ORF type:complete len:139 (+),score=24.13 GILI01047898.1:47-463(+)
MFFILLAAILWGCTSPLLKKYSKGFSAPTDGNGGVLRDIKFLLSRPKYLITQILNLSGSVAFFYALREVDVSVASVVTNSLAFVLTIIVSVFILNEGSFKPRTWLGTLLVLAGVSLCTFGAAVKEPSSAAGGSVENHN